MLSRSYSFDYYAKISTLVSLMKIKLLWLLELYTHKSGATLSGRLYKRNTSDAYSFEYYAKISTYVSLTEIKLHG